MGNICRSPMAQVVLADRLDSAGLSDRVTLTSSGTGGWHAGNAMDPRAADVLTERGYDASRHRARQLTRRDLAQADLVLVMDGDNLAGVLQLDRDAEDRVRLFRDHDPSGPGDVPDPYYGGPDGFGEVLAMVERTADAVVASLQHERPHR